MFNPEPSTATDASPRPCNSDTLPSMNAAPSKFCNTHERPAFHKGHLNYSCDVASPYGSVY